MAWIVKNLLRGTLTFKGAGISIAPKGEADLDELLGRARAETSNQVIVAFEEGYLQTVRKDDHAAAARDPAAEAAALRAEAHRAVDDRMERFRASLQEELSALRASLAGDVRGMLDGLQLAKAKIREQKGRVLEDHSLSDAEIRARLATLDEEERALEKNFSELGRKRTKEGGGVAEKADLLASM
jgi:hypothetical protein